MSNIWTHLRSFILLIFLTPILILFIGPLLVLTALRGRQPLGFITLNTRQYGGVGRVGALMLGLALWLLIWSGLAWLGLNYISPTSSLIRRFIARPPTATPAPTETPLPPPSLTFTPSPTLAQPSVTPLLVSIPLTDTPVPPPGLPTLTPILIPNPTFTPTPTSILPSPIAQQNQAPAPTLSATPTATNPSTPFPLDELSALSIIETGNNLLRDVLTTKEDNLAQLETIWRGQALNKAISFVTEQQQLYTRPLQVEFEYLTPPTISAHSTANQVVVISQERWQYNYSGDSHQEAFEFIYTLTRDGDEWIISNYTYRNLTNSTTP